MKLAIPLLLIFSTNVMAQLDLDLREINDEATQQASASNKTDNYLTRTFSIPLGKLLPKNRRLTPSEKGQKKVISCAEKILKENKGGHLSPQVAAKAIQNILDENNAFITDLDQLSRAADDCNHAYYELVSVPDNQLDINKKNQEMEKLQSTSAGRIVKRLSSTGVYKCYVTIAQVQAGLLHIGASVGVGELKCLMFDGKVRNYLGPKIGYLLGFGAQFSIRTTEVVNSSVSGSVGGYTIYGEGEKSFHEIQLPIGAINTENNSPVDGFSIGLAAIGAEPGIGGGIRVFNGPRRWGWLLERLQQKPYKLNNFSSQNW